MENQLNSVASHNVIMSWSLGNSFLSPLVLCSVPNHIDAVLIHTVPICCLQATDLRAVVSSATKLFFSFFHPKSSCGSKYYTCTCISCESWSKQGVTEVDIRCFFFFLFSRRVKIFSTLSPPSHCCGRLDGVSCTSFSDSDFIPSF